MKVVGLMGAIGCGKGTVAEYLVNKYGFQMITIGDMVREEVKKRGLELTRELTTQVSEECRKKDPLFFMRKAVEKIKNSGHDKWIIDAMRQPIDIEFCKKEFPSIKLVLVDVSPKLRFERMLSRGRADMPKTYEDFLAQEKLERDKFHLDVTFKQAMYVLKNDGTQEELHSNVDALMKQLKIPKK